MVLYHVVKTMGILQRDEKRVRSWSPLLPSVRRVVQGEALVFLSRHMGRSLRLDHNLRLAAPGYRFHFRDSVLPQHRSLAGVSSPSSGHSAMAIDFDAGSGADPVSHVDATVGQRIRAIVFRYDPFCGICRLHRRFQQSVAIQENKR